MFLFRTVFAHGKIEPGKPGGIFLSHCSPFVGFIIIRERNGIKCKVRRIRPAM